MHGCKQQSYRTRSPCVSAPKKGEKTNPPKNDNTNKKYETLSAPTPKCWLSDPEAQVLECPPPPTHAPLPPRKMERKSEEGERGGVMFVCWRD